MPLSTFEVSVPNAGPVRDFTPDRCYKIAIGESSMFQARWTLFLGFAFFFLSASISAQTGDIKVGRPFPDLRLPALDGKGFQSVQDWRGRKLVLHVWASW